MHKHTLPFILAAILALCSPALAATPIAITGVTDGDTVRAMVDGREIRIRLYGIDAPEMRQPFGRAAKSRLQDLTRGKAIAMETKGRDRYGRTVALIRAGGKDVNAAMIEDGYAWVYSQYCKAVFCRQWQSLEDRARSARRGLWRDKNPVPPWEWRRLAIQ